MNIKGIFYDKPVVVLPEYLDQQSWQYSILVIQSLELHKIYEHDKEQIQ